MKLEFHSQSSLNPQSSTCSNRTLAIASFYRKLSSFSAACQPLLEDLLYQLRLIWTWRTTPKTKWESEVCPVHYFFCCQRKKLTIFSLFYSPPSQCYFYIAQKSHHNYENRKNSDKKYLHSPCLLWLSVFFKALKIFFFYFYFVQLLDSKCIFYILLVGSSFRA